MAIPAMLLGGSAAKAQDMAVYTDSLQNSWQNWSWATTNLSNTNPVHAGADSIAITAGAWAAFYAHSNPIDTSAYTSLRFWINGGATGGQLLQVVGNRNGAGQSSYALGALTSGWQQITIPLSSLGVANVTDFDGFYIQDRSGTAQATFFVDDISLIGVPFGAIAIDAFSSIHPISPYIYGMNWASTAQIQDMNLKANRSGGNINSTYNWKNNATNHAADWFFESLGGSSTVPGADEDSFVTSTKSGNAEPILTIPTLGWVAKQGPNGERYSSFSVAKYGAQQSTDPWWSDAGNGVRPDGSQITGNDPNDAFVPSDVNYIKPDLTRIVNKFGTAANGGVKFYILDNEVDIWHGTHRDAHPVGTSIDEMLGYTKTYGAAVKAADPTAKVIGMEVWNWTGCITSGYDAQKGQGTDRAAHGNMDVYPYILQQLNAYTQATGIRPLDYLSIHFYPQGTDGGNDNSVSTQLLRNRATRQLWDRNYTSESWVNTKIYAIPHLKDWINTYYPGTKTAITEYAWGGENTMNGATTMADELGIFGREGLDIATRWGVPASPSYEAFKLYTNYDGNKSTFGDTSVGATVVNPDNLSTFAALRSSDGALTIMVINKTLSGTTPVTLNISNFKAGGSAKVWQVSSPAIVHQPDVPVNSGIINLTVPASSITLFVVPAAAASLTSLSPSSANSGSGSLTLTVNGSGFNANSQVLWNGSALTRLSMTPTQLTATVPAARLASAGTASVTVSNAPGLNSNTLTFTIVNSDSTAPATTASVSGSTVTLTATDAGSGVAATYYTIDGGARQTYSTPFSVAANSVHTVSYWSVDRAGNTETAKSVSVDATQYNFESSTQGWVAGGSPVTGIATSTTQKFAGARSLAVSFNGAAGSSLVSVAAPSTPAGKTVTFHVWIPSGSQISSIQPYAQDHNWAWSGTWKAIGSLQTNAWNTITVAIPTNAATPLQVLGVQFNTSAAWTGTCYVDSVSW